VTKKGSGTAKGADLIEISIKDNGPGIGPDDVVKVFGEYLASSKFGRGRCSRGQQGIGISAVTTWAQLTHGKGATVITKKSSMKSAIKCVVELDIKQNKGILRERESVDWDQKHGVECRFLMDARVQLNGEGGLLTYLQGTALVNPHLTLHYKLLDNEPVHIERITDDIPQIPQATEPHPHTMKLGEFMAHSHLYGKIKTRKWLKTAFSRISDGTISNLPVPKKLLDSFLTSLSDKDLRTLYKALQEAKLLAPTTKSVLSIGEELLAHSIRRMGEIDFFSVVSRKPAICDFKPVQVEIAIARFSSLGSEANDSPVQVLRFANRVPLQFDKSSCAIVKAIESVNWKAYGLNQPKKSLPQGPYIIAVSMVSPFIKFKNASKETIDASDELVDEFRKAMIQAGQKLGKHIKREAKMADVERKLQHIELFAPILVKALCRVTNAKASREKKALDGLAKILGRDSDEAHKELKVAHAAVRKLEANSVTTDEVDVEAIKKPKKKSSKASSSKKPKEDDDDNQMDLDL
jgi:DNA topoisomerase-6 subunit B